MKLNQNIKFRDVDRILKRNGFTYIRTKGSHVQYVRGNDHVVVNNPKTNPCVWLRICKEHKLII